MRLSGSPSGEKLSEEEQIEKFYDSLEEKDRKRIKEAVKKI